MVIMEKISSEELFIDTWLMSCRVLKRGMEEFVMNSIIQAAQDAGFRTISAEYIPTPKNRMVKDIYETMGFEKAGEGMFHINTEEYIVKTMYIKEEKGSGSK